METFKIIYTVLGGLGIFFYGMKTMSDALQQAASDVITKVINSLTSNRVLAVTVGVIVTMIVQSSSVTTVMVVGFVNAGLMQLTQAIGVIFGSNIGTTVTGWIISIKVGKYGLLMIGVGIFPALFSKNNKLQNIGRVLFGIGMVFLGLELMSGAFKPLRSNDQFLDMISYFSGQNYGAYFASILTGCLLTVIIQSSSAMLGITIALASSGVISFSTAAALVLGENIGTTITALLASVGTSTNAKRAARAHALFNVFGVMVMFMILPVYIEFIERIVPGVADAVAADGSHPNVAAHIAASHTIFNITATLLFLPFLGYLARFVTYITPERQPASDFKHLVLVGDIADIVPATAIVQAESETHKMSEIIERMYNQTRGYLEAPRAEVKEKVASYEQITDNIQKEVTVFLCKVMEKPMSEAQSLKSQGLIKIVDELESIADYLERVVNYKSRLSDKFQGASDDEYNRFLGAVWEFYHHCLGGFDRPAELSIEEIYQKSEQLRKWADEIRDQHLERIGKGEYDGLSALTYSDMVVALRKIRAHAMNIAEAIGMFNRQEA